jgi:SsrA-binding protein
LALNHYASGVKNSGTKNQSVRASSVLAENRRARFDYEILAGAHVVIRGNEAYLLNTEIAPYQALNTPKDHDPRRNRKLLIKKSEIKYLIGKNQTERLTTVPIKLYNKSGLVKVMIALVRSKKKRDKRETIKKRDAKREIERTLKRK